MTRSVRLVGVAALLLVVLPASAVAGTAPHIGFAVQAGGATDYGTIDAGTTKTQTFTLTNSGGTATSALKVSLTGSSAFSIPTGGDRCTATSLGPKKTCSVSVQYAPTMAGQTDSTVLKAVSKKPAATATITLSGASTASNACRVTNGTTATTYTSVQAAQDAATSGDTLTVKGTCVGTPTLSTDNLTITGQGPNPTLDGNHSGTVLIIGSGITATVNSLTITNGIADDVVSLGGGIWNQGTLTLNTVSVTANSSPGDGGGIENFGTMTLNDSTVSFNTASNGAGIHNEDVTGVLTLNGTSTISHNTATDVGGGIANIFGLVTMNDTSSVTQNSALEGGGGVYNNGGTVTINGGTVTGNTPDDILG